MLPGEAVHPIRQKNASIAKSKIAGPIAFWLPYRILDTYIPARKEMRILNKPSGCNQRSLVVSIFIYNQVE